LGMLVDCQQTQGDEDEWNFPSTPSNPVFHPFTRTNAFSNVNN
jgi:hypothetical protein